MAYFLTSLFRSAPKDHINVYVGSFSSLVKTCRFASFQYAFLSPPLTFLHSFNLYTVQQGRSLGFITHTLDKWNSFLDAGASSMLGMEYSAPLPPPAITLIDVATTTAFTSAASMAFYFLVLSCSSCYATKLFIPTPSTTTPSTSPASSTLHHLSPSHSKNEIIMEAFLHQRVIIRTCNFMGGNKDNSVAIKDLEKTVSGVGHGQHLMANIRCTSEGGGRWRYFFVDWDILKHNYLDLWLAFHSTIPWAQYKQ